MLFSWLVVNCKVRDFFYLSLLILIIHMVESK